jgi:hypothetical protein
MSLRLKKERLISPRHNALRLRRIRGIGLKSKI